MTGDGGLGFPPLHLHVVVVGGGEVLHVVPESLHQFPDGGVKVRGSLLGPLLVSGDLEVPELLGHALPDGLDEVQSELVRNQLDHLQGPLDDQGLEPLPVEP